MKETAVITGANRGLGFETSRRLVERGLRVVLTSRDGPERSFPLTKDSSTLGRHRNNDIVISDPKVSAFHARID